MILPLGDHFGKITARQLVTIHYDSAPRPQRSCFAHPNIYTVTLIHVLHSNLSFNNYKQGHLWIVNKKGFDSLYFCAFFWQFIPAIWNFAAIQKLLKRFKIPNFDTTLPTLFKSISILLNIICLIYFFQNQWKLATSPSKFKSFYQHHQVLIIELPWLEKEFYYFCLLFI